MKFTNVCVIGNIVNFETWSANQFYPSCCTFKKCNRLWKGEKSYVRILSWVWFASSMNTIITWHDCFFLNQPTCNNKFGKWKRKFKKKSLHAYEQHKDWLIKNETSPKFDHWEKIYHFFSYHHDNWSKWLAHCFVILTKFHGDSSKIVDFY